MNSVPSSRVARAHLTSRERQVPGRRSGTSTEQAGEDAGAPASEIPLTAQPLWCVTAWVLLGSLLTWSYGANNVPFPLLGFRVPLVDVVLIALVARSAPWWRPWIRTRPGSTFFLLLVLVSVFSIGRAVIDSFQYGTQALRGAIFAIEVWSLLLGVALVRRLGTATALRMITRLFVIALAWFVLFPLRDQFMRFSPIVGVQRPALLFSFVSSGLVGAWALFWFASRRDLRSIVATMAAVFTILVGQSRGVLAGIIVAITLASLAGRRGRQPLLFQRLGAALAVVVVVLALLPPVTGRLGQVSFDTMVDVVRTAVGQEGRVTSSYRDRQDWIASTLETVRTTDNGWLVGTGFGRDLTGGFNISGGTRVVMPHNDFLEFPARLGLFVIPWLLLWVNTFRQLWAQARSGERLAVWGLSAFVVMVFVSLTQPVNSFAYGGLVWWMLVGILLASFHRTPHRPDDTAPPGASRARRTPTAV